MYSLRSLYSIISPRRPQCPHARLGPHHYPWRGPRLVGPEALNLRTVYQSPSVMSLLPCDE